MNGQNENELISENQPAQKELDLGFSQIEPITRKKPIESTNSFGEKINSLLFRFVKKSNNQSNLEKTKKSNLADSTEIENEKEDVTEPVIATVTAENEAASSENSSSVLNGEKKEPKISTTMLKSPENWVILQKLPPKYRRVFIVLLLIVIILLIMSWLKPDTETVHYFEQADHSIPTQFQSLDDTDSTKNVLEITHSQNNLLLTKHIEDKTDLPNDSLVDNKTDENSVQQQAVITEKVETPVQQSPIVEENTSAHKQVIAPAPMPATKTVTNKSLEQKQKTEVKATTSQHSKVNKEEKVTAPVIEAKPIPKNKEKREKTKVNSKANVKTLNIPQGNSLMQVFRNNNLNIADVNAMTKAKNAGNILSSFKAGDKVKVVVNPEGRVTELHLLNGSRFIRQANGSYIFKK